MSFVANIEETVARVPLWGWGVLAGGGVLLLLARRGHPTASAIVDPNNPAPLGSATDAAGAAANTALDTITATGQADAARIRAAGDVTHQQAMDSAAGLSNIRQQFASIFSGGFMPSVFDVTAPDGTTISVDNTGVWQNALANTQGGWANQVAQTQGAWAAATAHDANYYQTLRDYNAGNAASYQALIAANPIAAYYSQNANQTALNPSTPVQRLFCGPGDPGCQASVPVMPGGR